MRPKILLLLFIGFTQLAVAQVRTSDTTYAQMWRPQMHFSAKKNWLNDPNGLIYHAGEYHLFFQHNPQGIRWGHMSWGHAVSHDLLHWQELPLALPEQPAADNPADTVMAFSGSCVVDKNNTAGFGKNALVAIYTGHRKGNQSQYIAYSLDRGRTFRPYANNPVLDRNQADFRDPSVFWHEGTGRWVMTVVLPAEQRMLVYQAKNLKDWVEVSSFQVRNPAQGIWECPAFFPVPVAGQSTVRKWVLLQSIGSGAVARGSGMRYFVGEFDGYRFTPQDTLTRWVDYGPDYYAAIPVANLPKPVTIGWMNNWVYAQDVPTTPFRSAMTLPRSLQLVETKNGYLLSQQPVKQLSTLYADKGISHSLATGKETPFSRYVANLGTAPFELTLSPGQESVAVRLGYAADEELVIGFDAGLNQVYLDRSRVGVPLSQKVVGSRFSAPLPPQRTGQLGKQLRVFIDRSSVELFTENGLVNLTCQFFPTAALRSIEVDGKGMKLRVRRLNSIWP